MYGTTYYGGADPYGYGAVLPPPLAVANLRCWLRSAAATLSGDTLYGTTENGGANNDGAVFALNIAPATIALSSSTSATIIARGDGHTWHDRKQFAHFRIQPELHAQWSRPERQCGAGGDNLRHRQPCSGGSQSCTVPATSITLGVTTISFTGSDPNSSNLSQTTTATLTVLDHAAAAFAGGGGTLNLNFGTLQVGSGTQDRQFQIENLPSAYRVGLALESVMALSDPDGLFSTDATPFPDLPAGQTSGLMDLFFTPSQLGNFSGQYQFNLSDKRALSGWTGGQTLTLNVTAGVVPKPSARGMLGVAGVIVLVVHGWQKKIREGKIGERKMNGIFLSAIFLSLPHYLPVPQYPWLLIACQGERSPPD